MMEPTSGNRMVNTVVLVFTLFAGLVVALRLFTRGLILKITGLEDVFITVAMVFSVGLAVTIAVQIMNGMGLHVQEIPPKEFVISQKAFWGSVWIYNLSLTLTKLSILAQYLRIFPNPRFRLNCYIAIAVVGIWGTWTFFGNFFICTPVSFFWDKNILRGQCLNEAAVWFTNASVNIVQDIIILAMPIAMLRTLDIPSPQKKALIIVFAFGAIVCVVSIIRLHTLVAISNSKDPTYDNLAAAMLSAIEVNIGIICACLPSMRPLFSAIMPTYFPSSNPPSNARRTQDEERAKHQRFHSETTLAAPVPIASKIGHSRTGSNSSQLRTPMSAKTLHSRSGSCGQPYTPPSAKYIHSRNGSAHSLRAQSRDGTELDHIQRPPADSRTYVEHSHHTRTQSEPLARGGPLYRSPNASINNSTNSLAPPYSQSHSHSHSHSRNGSQPTLDMHATPPPWMQSRSNSPSISGLSRPSTASVHHQHKLHPLRLQPAIPETPRLPRLPENMAIFDPFQRPLGGARGGAASGTSTSASTPRRMVFHKPLPITPYPIAMTT